jgi:hypothetical protein
LDLAPLCLAFAKRRVNYIWGVTSEEGLAWILEECLFQHKWDLRSLIDFSGS